MTKEQNTALKEVMALLHDATYNKKERYIINTTDQNGTTPGIVTRVEYLELIMGAAEEKLELAFGKD